MHPGYPPPLSSLVPSPFSSILIPKLNSLGGELSKRAETSNLFQKVCLDLSLLSENKERKGTLHELDN